MTEERWSGVRVVCCFLNDEEFEQVEDGRPGRAGQAVKVVPDCERGRLFIFMLSGTDEEALASELSWEITEEGKRAWMYARTDDDDLQGVA